MPFELTDRQQRANELLATPAQHMETSDITETELAAMQRNIASVKATNKAFAVKLDNAYWNSVLEARTAGLSVIDAHQLVIDAWNRVMIHG